MTFQSLARQSVGALGDSVESSRRSLARQSYSNNLMRDEQYRFAKGATSVASVIAESLHWIARLGGDTPMKRILVVEPRTRNIGMALRAKGVQAETTALMHAPLPRELEIAQGYDRCVTYDWLSLMDEATTPATPTTTSTPTPGGASDSMFDAVIVSDLTRILSPTRLTEALTLLASHIVPQGCLVLAEPAHIINSVQLTCDVVSSGLELMMDPETVADDWPRIVMIWQRRTPSEAMRSGVAHRIFWMQLAHDRPLQLQLISAYQEVFGGDEWCEWVKCSRPGCERQYSQKQARALKPPDRCVCGWDAPLTPYHSASEVLARLYQELTPGDASCAYIRFGGMDSSDTKRTVAGFAWGYVTDPYRLTRTLLPPLPATPMSVTMRDDLAHRLTSLLHRAQRNDNPAVIYYHADSGIVETTRSLSLTRYLFERSLQFARKQGADVVVLRTSVRSPAFRLLIGLGMRPLYWYAGDQHAEHLQETRVHTGTSRLDTGALGAPSLMDERVVLWGDISALLGIFSSHSDFRLAGRIARGLRAARDESEQAQ